MKSMLTIKHILIKSGYHEHGYFSGIFKIIKCWLLIQKWPERSENM